MVSFLIKLLNEPMGKCFTLIYSIDNLIEPSAKFIDLEQCFNEIDDHLRVVLNAIELDVDTNLVKKTLALAKGNQ
jgi:hypothetical protein